MIRKHIEKNFTSDNGASGAIVARLNRVFKLVNARGFSDEVSAELEDDIRNISERFGVCPKAAILLAAVMEQTISSNSCDDEDLSAFIGATGLEFLGGFQSALRELEDKGVIMRSNGRKTCYIASLEAMKAVEKDSEFVPAKTSGLTTEEVFTRIRKMVCDYKNGNIDGERFLEEFHGLVERNPQLLFCRKVAASELWSPDCSDTERRMFVYMCHRYVTHGDEAVPIEILLNCTEFMEDEKLLQRRIANGKTGIQTAGLVTFGNISGYVDNEKLSLSDEVKGSFFQEVELAPNNKVSHKDLISASGIKEQQLFYNEREEEAIGRLESLLQEDNFKAVQERLESQGMQRNLCCLLSGLPGTGKTAILKEIARRTGRDIFWVDLSSLKNKYVGESEKQVKALFQNYRGLVKTQEKAPILAFNEADAILTKRLSNVEDSVDLMMNAISDICLNEIENLDGIMIATTNLAGNMMDDSDSALERRFLFKLEISAPDESVREKIWHSKLPHLPEADVKALAAEFELCGGNIENVARKSVVDYVLTGAHSDLDTLRRYCEEESFIKSRKGSRKIGYE